MKMVRAKLSDLQTIVQSFDLLENFVLRGNYMLNIDFFFFFFFFFRK